MRKVSITSAVELSNSELTSLKTTLSLTADDVINVVVDPSLIAGLKVSVNGKTVDLSVKQQLAEIVLE